MNNSVSEKVVSYIPRQYSFSFWTCLNVQTFSMSSSDFSTFFNDVNRIFCQDVPFSFIQLSSIIYGSVGIKTGHLSHFVHVYLLVFVDFKWVKPWCDIFGMHPRQKTHGYTYWTVSWYGILSISSISNVVQRSYKIDMHSPVMTRLGKTSNFSGENSA